MANLFNINTIVDFRYYDYVSVSNIDGKPMLGDTTVYNKSVSSSRAGKPINRLIITKASSDQGEQAYSEDYGSGFNLFIKGYTQDWNETPYLIGTSYIVEAKKELKNLNNPEEGHKIVYGLPGRFDFNDGQLSTSDEKIYDYPVMGIFPMNVRGLLNIPDPQTGKANSHLGERDIIVRPIFHRDVTDWDATFDKYINKVIDKEGYIVYSPDHLTVEDLTVNRNANVSGDCQLNNLNADGSTYLKDLYVTDPENPDQYVPFAKTVKHTITQDLHVDLGSNVVGGAIDQYEYPADTSIEEILRDILIVRYCTSEYKQPSINFTLKATDPLGRTISSGQEVRKSQIKFTVTATYDPKVTEYSIHGNNYTWWNALKNIQIGDSHSFDWSSSPEVHREDVYAETRDMSNGQSWIKEISYSIPEGTVENGARLIIDSKGDYNGVYGITYSSNINRHGYSVKQASSYNNAENPKDKDGCVLSTWQSITQTQRLTWTSIYKMFWKASTSTQKEEIGIIDNKRNGWESLNNQNNISILLKNDGVYNVYVVSRYPSYSSVKIVSKGFTTDWDPNNISIEKIENGAGPTYVDDNTTFIEGYYLLTLSRPSTSPLASGDRIELTLK